MLDYFVWTDALPASSTDEPTDALNEARAVASTDAPAQHGRVSLHRPALRPRLRRTPPAD